MIYILKYFKTSRHIFLQFYCIVHYIIYTHSIIQSPTIMTDSKIKTETETKTEIDFKCIERPPTIATMSPDLLAKANLKYISKRMQWSLSSKFIGEGPTHRTRGGTFPAEDLDMPIFHGQVCVEFNKTQKNGHVGAIGFGQAGKSTTFRQFIDIVTRRCSQKPTRREIDNYQAVDSPTFGNCLYPLIDHDQDAYFENLGGGNWCWNLSDTNE